MDDLLPYRLWHETLQHGDPRRWSKKVRSALGTARDLPFDEWWKEVSEFFVVPAFTVEPINDEEQAAGWWKEYGDDPNVKLLYVNLHTPNSVLIRDFGRLVRSLTKKKAGRPAIDQTVPDFPLEYVPKKDAVRKMLKCYELHAQNQQRPKEQRRTLYQMGVTAKVSPNHVVHAEDDRLEAASKRRLMSISTSRMIKNAMALVENAGKGRFPLY